MKKTLVTYNQKFFLPKIEQEDEATYIDCMFVAFNNGRCYKNAEGNDGMGRIHII